MGDKIIVCGLNGSGKTTLGKELARKLGYPFRDIEDYFFLPGNTEYNHKAMRTKEEVTKLLLADMNRYENLVFAAVKGNYGEEIASLFTCAVMIYVPKEIRVDRVKKRSYEKFGDRMLPGGDMYEREKAFFDMVESRSEDMVAKWLEPVKILIIRVDGTQPVEKSIAIICAALK